VTAGAARRTIAALAAGAIAAAWAAAGPRAQEHADTPDDLPPGAGRDETFYACAACHGVAIIRSQGMSRERWEHTVDEMIRRHAMPEPDAGDRRLILDYLATAFPPRARGRPNPFVRQP